MPDIEGFGRRAMNAAEIERVLLAGMAGDAIGFAFEGRARVDAVVLPPVPWRISDDTIMTLATCRALVRVGRPDPAAIAAAFVEVFRRGPIPGIGASTLKALRDLDAGAHWALAGRSGDQGAGNGAAMRVAPLALFLAGEQADERRLVRDICRITHRNDEAYVGALAVILAIHGVRAARELTGPVLCAEIAATLPDTRVRDALLRLSKLGEDADAHAAAAVVGTGGHAAETVPLALFIAGRSLHNAPDAILAAVACGGDTDTIAAIAGQVCGAAGAELPETWTAKLPAVDEVRQIAAALGALALPA